MSEIKNEKSTTEKEVHNKIARNCSEPKPIISISFCKLCPILEFSMTLNNINVVFLQHPSHIYLKFEVYDEMMCYC